MKRKFINGLLLVALFVGFTGSMVSCKDYDDDKIGNLEGIIADKEKSLQELIEAQKIALETQINNLRTDLENCSTTCAQFRDTVNLKFAQYYTLIQNTNQFIADSIYTKAEIDAMLAKLEEELKNYLDAEAIARAVADQLNKGNQALEGALEAYFGRSATILNLQKAVSDINDSLRVAKALAQSAYDLAWQNADKIGKLEGRVGSLEERMGKAEGAISGLDQRLTKVEGGLQLLGQTVEEMKGAIVVLSDSLEAARNIADNAWALAQTNYDLIQELGKNYLLMLEMIGEVDGKVEGLKTRMTTAESDIANLRDEVRQNKLDADELHKKMQEEIAGLAEEAERLANEIAATKAAIYEQIQLILDSTITALELNGSYCPLFGEFSFFTNARTNMLVAYYGEADRGVEFPTIDDTYSALPDKPHLNAFTEADVDMLWGKNSSVEDAKGYMFLAPVKTWQLLANDGETGNAGTLYFTVNPANVDFSNTTFELINSKNEVSPVVISDVKKSDHLLNFGYTRAASTTGNGFYEAKATIAPEVLDEVSAPNLDLSGIKDVIVDLKNNKDAFNVTQAANVIYNNLNAILPAQALKANWSDKYGDHSFVSQYSIAATKVKPLSFAFASMLDYSDHFPGLGKAEDFIDRIVGKICGGLPDLNPYDMEIDSIVLVDLDPQVIHGRETAGAEIVATFHIYIPNNHLFSIGPRTVKYEMQDWVALTANDEERVIHPSNPTITLEIVPAEPNAQGYSNQWVITLRYDISDEIRHLNNYYTEDWTEGDNIVKQIREYMDDVNNFLDKILNFNDRVQGTITSSIFNFLESATKKFTRFMTPNKYLQPVILVKSDNGYSRLGEGWKYPTHLNAGTIELVPTTYNAEILTPAYKKFVAVTNVLKDGKSAKEGNQECINVLKAANQQNSMCQVINGGAGTSIEFNAKAGYVYEIVFSALDYSGKVSSRKYYFKAI